MLARGAADEPPRRRGGRARPPHRGRAAAARPSSCSPRSRRCELTAPLFGGSEPVAPERFARHRRLPLAPGAGPKLLAAIAAHQWAYSGGSAAECAPLALAALEGGDLIRGGNLVLSVAATMVLVLADREEALDAWAALLAHAHASGSLGFKAATSVFRGYTLCATASSPTRRPRCATRSRSSRSGTSATRAASRPPRGWPACCASAATSPARGASSRPSATAATPPTAARYWLDSHAEQLLAEEQFDEALAVARDAARALRRPARDRHAGALAPGRSRSTTSAAARRRSRSPPRRSRSRGAGARPRSSRGRCGSWAPSSSEHRAPARGRGARRALSGAARARQGAGRAGRRAARRPPARPRRATRCAGRSSSPTRSAPTRSPRACARSSTPPAAARARPRCRACDALTPSERRVAERAAAGQTNRAIAEALFVTPKTVELHLRNAYRKLGARNRHDLAGAARAPVGRGIVTRRDAALGELEADHVVMPDAEAIALAHRLWGLELADAVRLETEQDDTFRLDDRYVLKVSQPGARSGRDRLRSAWRCYAHGRRASRSRGCSVRSASTWSRRGAAARARD